MATEGDFLLLLKHLEINRCVGKQKVCDVMQLLCKTLKTSLAARRKGFEELSFILNLTNNPH